jgi:hypothetical protein
VPSTNRSLSRALKLTPFSICRYNKAGIRDVRSIGADFVLSAWTAVRPCSDCAETNKQDQQDYCVLASERKCGPCNNRTRFCPSHSISRRLTKIARWDLASAQNQNRRERGPSSNFATSGKSGAGEGARTLDPTDHPFDHYCTKSRSPGKYLAAQTLTEMDGRSGYCVNPAWVRT